jgi:hypothetical protein
VIHEGLASQLQALVTYLAGLAGASGLGLRLATDWVRRDARRPKTLSLLTDLERRAVEDRHSWALWLATILGSAGGVGLGLSALVVGALWG